MTKERKAQIMEHVRETEAESHWFLEQREAGEAPPDIGAFIKQVALEYQTFASLIRECLGERR